MSRQGMNEILHFRSKASFGDEGYVIGANSAVSQLFAGDTDAKGGDFCRMDDESEISA